MLVYREISHEWLDFYKYTHQHLGKEKSSHEWDISLESIV